MTFDKLTSPITRFFKPVSEQKVGNRFDMKDEVQKFIATSTPILKDKTSLINTEKIVNGCKQDRLRNESKCIHNVAERLCETNILHNIISQ